LIEGNRKNEECNEQNYHAEHLKILG
jgi:hypothetical protein